MFIEEFIMNLSLRKIHERPRDSGSIKGPALRVVLAAVVLTIPISVVANASKHSAHSSQGAAPTVNKEDLLWWLPPDTESVVAARGPFSVRVGLNTDEHEDLGWFTRKASLSKIRLNFERLPLELFRGLDWARSLRGAQVAFAMQGSRHFRPPLPGLEVMDYEGCSIVVFKNELGERGHGLVRRLAEKANRTEIVARTTVLVFHEKLGQAEWDYFFAIPQPKILLVANNPQYLQEVLERMRQKKSPRALPDELPEWRFLDPDAQFWGLRHYDRSQAKQDPTSPFGGDRSFSPGDEQAIGILFALDPRNQRNAVITSLSGDYAKVREAAGTGTSVSEPQEGVRYEVKLRSPKPGVLEHAYTLDRSSTLDYFVLIVEVALGRGMYF
jgi:hypothetical protein